MKILKNVKTKVADGKVTITAEIGDVNLDLRIIQQQTVLWGSIENMRWPRHIQISNEAVFVRAFGNGFAFLVDDLVQLAAQVEPKTSYPPVFKKSVDQTLTAEISTELDPEFKWQVADDLKPDSTWTDIEGQTTKTLDRTKVLSGKFVRCVASSEAGKMFSNPVLIK